jgi:hypothetical protein
MLRLFLFSFVLCSACGGDLIATANSDCAGQSDNCQAKTASGLLYLDTGNLPSSADGAARLMLCSSQPEDVCQETSLELRFVGGPLTADVDPGFAHESGWKVRFSELSVGWVEPPSMVVLNGRLGQLEFVFDPDDELSPSLELK